MNEEKQAQSKQVRISVTWHKTLKMSAAERDISMSQLLNQLIENGLCDQWKDVLEK